MAALTTYGNYASIIVLIHLMWKLILTIIGTIRTRRKGVTWKTAIRLNTLLLTEFRIHLIQDIPLRHPEHTVNTDEQDSTELVPSVTL